MRQSGCAQRGSQSENSCLTRFGSISEQLTGLIPAKRTARVRVGSAGQDQRIIVGVHELAGDIGITYRHDRVTRMTTDHHDPGFGARENLRLPSHWAVFAVERP